MVKQTVHMFDSIRVKNKKWCSVLESRFDNLHSPNSRLSSPARLQMAAATKFIEYHWISVDSVTVKSKKFKCVNDLEVFSSWAGAWAWASYERK